MTVTTTDAIQCNPSGVAMAEHLRTLAEMLESGELDGLAVCWTYRRPTDPTADRDAMGSGYWNDGNIFSLVAASTVLSARVLHGFGVPEVG